MNFDLVTVGLLIFSTVLILTGAKILFKSHWFLGFIRGFSGLSLIFTAAFLAMVAMNLTTYSALDDGDVIANVSLKQLDLQSYEVSITDAANGKLTTFIIEADMWSLSTRELNVFLSSSHFYQLDHLQGRYYTLEQQKRGGSNKLMIANDHRGIDLWHYLQNKVTPFIEARPLKTAFIPLVNEALFSIKLRKHGLSITALNPAAQKAINP